MSLGTARSLPPMPRQSSTVGAVQRLSRKLLLLAGFVAAAEGSLRAQQSGAQSGAAVPQNSAPLAAAAQTGPLVLRGSVVDPDNAEIPGATVTLTPAQGRPFVVTSGSDGTYALRGVPPGTYSMTVTMPGFASFVRQGVRLTGDPLTINAKLAIADQKTVVNVTTDQNTVSIDQDSNASSSVLKGKDLDALSDDPDELSQELSALAGPAAGPNGGQIYIDGFTGGQLPPKSSIREIRINQNPFSAQYDRPGFGRVEVFTKPGTDSFHGSAQLNGADKSFNTGSPFIAPGTFQPDYHTVLFFGSLTGPINKHASFTMNGSYRNIQDNTVVDPPSIFSTSAGSGVPCFPGTAGCSQFAFNAVQFTPQTRYDVSPRVDLALGSKNTLTTRFQYEHNSASNQGIGGLDLASTGFNSASSEVELQISDTQIVSAKVINETRFEYQRSPSTQTPLSTLPQIDVQGAFNYGGNGNQTTSDTQNHIEVQNYTSVALARHFLRLGGRLRTTGETNTSTAGSNGAFLYNSINDYINGNLADFTITNIAQPTVSARLTDLGLYAEDDWKVRPNLTFSYGLRYETQNFISDHHDFAPRISAAYALGKKTVLRAGAGFFYDRFGLGDQLSTVRLNGVNQQQFTVSSANSTTGTIPATCNPAAPAGCTPLLTTAGRLTVRTIAVNQTGGFTNLRSGYQIQENFGVDQQLFRNATLSVNYQHIRGVHQYNSDVPNYASASPTQPLDYQFQSNGVFNQNQLVTTVKYSGRRGSVQSFYVLNFARADTAGSGTFASVPNNLAADYGRASFDVRNRVFLFGSLNLPHLVTLSPFLVASSGRPYNITAGIDQFHDNIFNSRAVFAAAGTIPDVPNGAAKTIGGCGTFATPGTLGNFAPVPINYCTGPASFTLNLRVAKTFGFGEKKSAANAASSADSGRGGPGGPPGAGGRVPGGAGPGGGRGGAQFGGGQTSSGKRYNFTVGAQAQNLFNIADRATPIGTLTSPLFGTSNQLAGNIFTTDSAVRRISLQLSFSF